MKLPYSYIGEPLYHVLCSWCLKTPVQSFEAGVSCDDAFGETSGRPLFGNTFIFKCPKNFTSDKSKQEHYRLLKDLHIRLQGSPK